ncbi:hypothetical protein LTR56_005380 [Elasticomyces elasticus]|nr:hypothetical protein LTR22_018659 [Elasticomyces elasticus]KAK3651873.1 hypothetical protein LTR56_005380 [Elasticomyces elasticus]KAK4927768.1 hypothetical protein LTR49_005392 [Elasticomyces elasticus]KAK5761439.1 hypothetical protein LTS12_008400 [Elasticomyces elasticus]
MSNMTSVLAPGAPLPVSVAPKKGLWTPEMATGLSLLNKNFNLSKGNSGRGDRVGRIFRRVFRADLAITHPGPLSDREILDYYDSRMQATRTKIFKNIIEVRHPCQDQQDRVAKVLPLLRQAIVDEDLSSAVIERSVAVAAQGDDEEEEEEEVEEGGETNKEVVKVESDGEYDEAQSRCSRCRAKRSRTSEVQLGEPGTKRSRTSKADDISGIRDSLVDQYGEDVVVKAESSNRETVYSRSGRELKPTEKVLEAFQDGQRKTRGTKTSSTTSHTLTNGLERNLAIAPSQDVDLWNTFASAEHNESRNYAARAETGSRDDKHGFLERIRETMPQKSRTMKKNGSPKALEQTSTAQEAEKVDGQVDASSTTGPLQFVGSASLALQQYFAPEGADFEDTHLFDLELWAIETGHRNAELEMQDGRLDGQGYGITDPMFDNGLLSNRYDVTSNLVGIIENHNRPRVHGVVSVNEREKMPATSTDATNQQPSSQQAIIGDVNNGSTSSSAANGPYMPTMVDGYMIPSKPPPSYVERQRRQREDELMAYINADPEIQALDAEQLLREHADRDKYLPPKLPMIHSREYDGPGVTAQNPLKLVFVDQLTATYELGGRVRRIFAMTAGGHQDVMMCNMAICGYCKDLYTPTPSESMEIMVREAQRTHGLPFVHSTDCFGSSAGDWHYFPNGAWPYQVKYPQMKRTNVIFTVKGSEEGTPAIETMMCDAEHCEDCTSKRDGEMDV